MAAVGSARQAVVVIHGSGAQPPMQALRWFADMLLGAEPRTLLLERITGTQRNPGQAAAAYR